MKLSENSTVEPQSRHGAAKNEGRLDGLTLLRFAHAFESGGGMERLLEDIDRSLLERNAMTLIRMFIASDRQNLSERTEQIGRGRIIRVPMLLPEGERLASDTERSGINSKQLFRNAVLYNPLVWHLFTRRFLLGWKIPRRSGEVIDASRKAAELMQRFSIDLIMLHFMGGSDADDIVGQAQMAAVPFAAENHYSNDRFLHLSIRKHAILAAGVGGMNGIDVPGYLRDRFCNLSDGIDTEFFRRENATRIPDSSQTPLVLLPARIVKPKGQLDLIRAAVLLRSRGLDFRIGFAGRPDSENFIRELREEIGRCGLDGLVEFPGVLSVEELRNWYAASAVVAFPTYHHEGLGRITVEAQAMKVPVVAYATGGVAEGLIPERTGYLVKTGDINGLANRLEELLRQPGLRERMGEAGRLFVEQRFSLEALAKRHEDFYLGVLAEKRRARSKS